ncbi:MAG: UDP-glucose/GDP-mannose dehydrogenase family protein [Candidatus Pacebacteria bacterium]|nr:UDP-glucose/GDP-mannose dehydrogenase family protein [Candidatus Paceibacterota bacterium]
MKKEITIIGTGYVGLTTGVCLASLGHSIICVDSNREKIKKLRKGEVPIFEPGLAELLESHQANIVFTDDLAEAVKRSQTIFLAVGTPQQNDGSVDLTFFQQAVRQVAQSMHGYKIIVDKSTVPVGTADWVKNEIAKYFKGDFSVVSNPEFLKEGTAVDDFLRPDRVVIGVDKDKKAGEILLDIYSAIDAPKLLTDIKSAELIKYASNAFLATKISFVNEIANICEKTGADILEVAKGIGSDSRIGPKFLKAGIGFGGSCLPKDTAGLIHTALSNNYQPKILQAAQAVNEGQWQIFAEKIRGVLKTNGGDTVGVWGLAFKPDTDDVRYSPAIAIIKELRKDGYKIRVYDPVAQENARAELGEGIIFCASALEAARGTDVLVLATEWPEFLQVDWQELKKTMRSASIADGRNFLPKAELTTDGFNYLGIGRI